LREEQAKLESRHKIYKLREALQQLAGDYDRIYIDTPPRAELLRPFGADRRARLSGHISCSH